MLQKYFKGDFVQSQENGDKLDKRRDDPLDVDMEGIEEEDEKEEEDEEVSLKRIKYSRRSSLLDYTRINFNG